MNPRRLRVVSDHIGLGVPHAVGNGSLPDTSVDRSGAPVVAKGVRSNPFGYAGQSSSTSESLVECVPSPGLAAVVQEEESASVPFTQDIDNQPPGARLHSNNSGSIGFVGGLVFMHDGSRGQRIIEHQHIDLDFPRLFCPSACVDQEHQDSAQLTTTLGKVSTCSQNGHDVIDFCRFPLAEPGTLATSERIAGDIFPLDRPIENSLDNADRRTSGARRFPSGISLEEFVEVQASHLRYRQITEQRTKPLQIPRCLILPAFGMLLACVTLVAFTQLAYRYLTERLSCWLLGWWRTIPGKSDVSCVDYFRGADLRPCSFVCCTSHWDVLPRNKTECPSVVRKGFGQNTRSHASNADHAQALEL